MARPQCDTPLRNVVQVRDKRGPPGPIAKAQGPTITKHGSWDNTHTSDLSSKGERLDGKPSTLVQHAQRMGGRSDG
jgi:hypothetical protein